MVKDINREAAKISVLASGKLVNYGYITGGDISPPIQNWLMEPGKLVIHHLGKRLKSNKINWKTRRKAY